MGNQIFREKVKSQLENGQCGYVNVMSDGGDRLHDGTNQSNEIGIWDLDDGRRIVQKVMLSSPKYHQKRKALTEMVHAWLDEGLGGERVVPLTYAETFEETEMYQKVWGKPQEPKRKRVCQVIHEWKNAVPGDEWRGSEYGRSGDLSKADKFCRMVIEAHPDAERVALLDFLTINQDRSARNWITDYGRRFWAIDNGMAWFHEYPHNDDWKIGTVIDDVLIQRNAWRFISGVFTTSYEGRQLSADLKIHLGAFHWSKFKQNIDLSCQWLGLPPLSEDWRFLGLKRRLDWIRDTGRFPTGDEYRSWLKGSELMTPSEIVGSGGGLIWAAEMDGE